MRSSMGSLQTLGHRGFRLHNEGMIETDAGSGRSRMTLKG
jgi:hypothetical protein